MPWVITRPIEKSSTIKFIDFNSDSSHAKDVFWHSSAHVLGVALEKTFGDSTLLCDGPLILLGRFFYKFLLLGTNGHDKIQKAIDKIVSQKHGFERIEVDANIAKDIFHDNPFKLHFIDRTLLLGKFKLNKVSSAHWVTDRESQDQSTRSPLLNRVYGISFPSSKQLQDHEVFLEEAKQQNEITDRSEKTSAYL
ncbi:threonyl-tRNA synthetase [Mycoemilia scoparia]|uniref:Threonyl-tRNA synthetase n=1 Tax=Mycoemilia scoparia TaxID=417184 RepID=A0A9W8A3N8_9FUNG|nr:threonyl-tRNA synthetase [Mycoemilia scoparia]